MNEGRIVFAKVVTDTDKPAMGKYRMRTARIWDQQLFRTLRCSFWDAVLRIVLQITTYDRTVSSETTPL